MSQPVIQVTIAISPHPVISLSEAENCNLTITATLQHEEPITIYTWGTIFNLSLAQTRYNFSCNDITPGTSQENQRINLHSSGHIHRYGRVSRQIGSHDDRFWVTFYPNQPIVFAEKFGLPTRGDKPLSPGHRYHYEVSQSWLRTWRWEAGTREDVLTTTGKEPTGGGEDPFQPLGISLPEGNSVEFEVAE